MVTKLTNEEALADFAAVREKERLADLERTRQGAPWNRPPHRSQRHSVSLTIQLFRAPPVDERDPIAGPEPVRDADHTPVAFRLLGEGGLLHLFAQSPIAEQCRRDPRDSVRVAFIHFIRGSGRRRAASTWGCGGRTGWARASAVVTLRRGASSAAA